jgi:hypothetical protein
MYNIELLIELFLLTLAVSRLSNAMVDEVWLFHTGLYIRHVAGVRYIKNDSQFYSVQELIEHYRNETLETLVRYPTTTFGELFNCYWCTSVWVALAFLVLKSINIDIYFWVVLVFALSAASIYLKDKIYS